MAGPPCPPNSPCWCATKPPSHPCHGNVGVPINGGIVFLLIAGLLLGVWNIYKKQIKIFFKKYKIKLC